MFQSTPPRRGDRLVRVRVAGQVSIHAPAKGRHGGIDGDRSARWSFNPRPREGATGLARCAGSARLSFNPRPREGATQAADDSRRRATSFNPRPREGATRRRDAAMAEPRVSIHAPAKGRPVADRTFVFDVVSIHAPAKGRPESCWATRPSISFNPRPREGATPPAGRADPLRSVSIHAPAKGRPGRHDLDFAPGVSVSIHAPAKGRHRPGIPDVGGTGFNPRPREGATAGRRRDCTCDPVSIHAPAKGRLRPRLCRRSLNSFQSTPPRRGDARGFGDVVTLTDVSIHAPAKGRRTDLILDARHLRFQSTPPRRGDHVRTRAINGQVNGFNPRPREGATD